MEKLEKIADTNYKIEENYAGLKLIEEKKYEGGTSIRYWM